MSELPRKLTLALLFATLAFCVYRARTQSLTVDEAWVFQLYVNQPWTEMAKTYDAANHVLHTVLMKLSRIQLGTGEVVLRLPTLLAAALYFTAVYRLTRILFRPWMQLVAVAVLILHPLVLDFFVAARGYGLALALFTWALVYVIRYFVQGLDRGQLTRAGVAAGLAIAANLTLLPPAAALGLMLVVLLWRDHGRRAIWMAIDTYGGPAVILPALTMLLPMLAFKGNEFYFGTASLSETTYSVVEAIVKRPCAVTSAAIPVLTKFIVPIVFWIIIAAVSVVIVRYLRAPWMDFRSAPFALVGGTLALTVGLLVLARYAFGVLYPLHRTALYLIPLFTLAALLALNRVRARWAAGVVFTILAAAYIVQLEPRYFAIWRFDASMASLMRRVQEVHDIRKSKDSVRLAASNVLLQTASYYKMRRRMEWLSLVESPSAPDADYYLLTGADRALVRSMNLQVVTDDSLSGTLLARRPQ